jgi:hypothetical protein
MIKISEFYGFEDHSDREAYIYLNADDAYVVEMILRDDEEKIIHKEQRDLSGHSIYYAEDCAENWVSGIIN